MSANKSFFEIFQLPQGFELDTTLLEQRYRHLQRSVHPDKYAGGEELAQRLAVQYSSLLNEARDTLKLPLRRAIYLLELAGYPYSAEAQTTSDAQFLMQQIEWREALDEADGVDALDALLAEARDARQQALTTLTQLIDEEANPTAAVQQVRALMFVERFTDEVHQRLERLES